MTLELADEIDLARGDLIVDPARTPRAARSLEATLVWLGQDPLCEGRRYLLQQATRRGPARIARVESRLDVHSLEGAPAAGAVGANDIVRVRLSLQSPFYVDPYEEVRATGALILIDEATNHTVAAGLVR